jgi:hypothetical protein
MNLPPIEVRAQALLDRFGYITIQFMTPRVIGEVFDFAHTLDTPLGHPLVIIGQSSAAEAKAQHDYLLETYGGVPFPQAFEDGSGKLYYRATAE